MRRFFWALGFLVGTAFSDTEVWIRDLGAAELDVRNQAQLALTAEGALRPRQTLTQLAKAYQTTDDLEILSRLEVLLTEMAREWMFYIPPGFLGINFQMIQLGDGDVAAKVIQVLPGGAAEEAGLLSNDLLLDINGVTMRDLKDQESFVAYVSTLRPGSSVEILIRRRAKELYLTLKIGERTVEQMDAAFFNLEERKIQEWLSGLRIQAPQDVRKPMGHFQVLEEE